MDGVTENGPEGIFMEDQNILYPDGGADYMDVYVGQNRLN